MMPDSVTPIILLFVLIPIFLGILFRKLSSKGYTLIDARHFSKQDQIAFLEAALLTYYFENSRDLPENIGFRTYIKQIKWQFDIDNEMARIRLLAQRALQNRQELENYMLNIKSKISSDEIAVAILTACKELADQTEFTIRKPRYAYLSKLEGILRPEQFQPQDETQNTRQSNHLQSSSTYDPNSGIDIADGSE